MTCIVGLLQGGKVWIGGDSAGVAGYALRARADRKVFTVGPFAIGFTTSFRMGQLLNHAFTPPLPKPGQDLTAFMVTDFVNAVRDCLKAGGFATKESEAEHGGQFLVGYRGHLFMVGSDYQVGEALAGFDAVGSGADVALGAMAVGRGAPKVRILAALAAAAKFNAGVRGPFHVVKTP